MRKQLRLETLMIAAVAAALSLPVVAQAGQQSTTTPPAQVQNQAQSAAQPAGQAATPAAAAQNEPGATKQQPLQPQIKQGFWGHLNPFARKKYVEGQLSPIRDRVNELNGLTDDNAKSISDLDARAKAGISEASSRAQKANDEADSAQQQVQQTSQQATQLNQQVGDANTKLQGVDQYQVAQQAELHFKPGPAKLNPDAQQQLGTFLQGLSGQKGYVVEVTAYSTRKGTAGVAASQALADSVVRYLVLDGNIPLYRIYTMGMGNAQPTQAAMNQAGTNAKPTAGGTVEIKILKNSLAQGSPSNL